MIQLYKAEEKDTRSLFNLNFQKRKFEKLRLKKTHTFHLKEMDNCQVYYLSVTFKKLYTNLKIVRITVKKMF